MSFWATVYLELWKRYASRITHQWDLSSFDSYEEYPRPEYLVELSKTEKRRLNVLNRIYEPYLPFWKKQLPYAIVSGSIIFFLIFTAMISVLGVIIYRVSVRAALSVNPDPTLVRFSPLITYSTAALINLFCILIFNTFYSKVAIYLTEREMPRTQTDFDNSLTLKLYLLQFVNYYSSIFYIAFFKGRFSTNPSDLANNSYFSDLTHEECGVGGCFLELAIQLAIIMVGKQALNAVTEMTFPWLEWCYNRYVVILYYC